MVNRKYNYCIIVPVYNEKEKLKLLLDRFPLQFLEKLIVIDDGSSDSTSSMLETRKIRYIRHKRRYGVGCAIKSGLKYAIKNKIDICVIMAGNNKDAPDEISRVLNPIIEGKADFIQGSRFLRGGRFSRMPLYRFIATRLIHPFLFSLKAGKFKTDTTNGFRAFKTVILEHPRINFSRIRYDSYEYEIIFYLRAIKAGFKCIEVPVSKVYPPKKLGITKIRPVWDWYKMLKPFFLEYLF